MHWPRVGILKNQVVQGSSQAGASEDSAPPAKAPRIAAAVGGVNAADNDAAAEAPALSIVEMAMQAAAMAAAGKDQAVTDLAQPAAQPASPVPSPAQHMVDAGVSSQAAPANVRLNLFRSELLLFPVLCVTVGALYGHHVIQPTTSCHDVPGCGCCVLGYNGMCTFFSVVSCFRGSSCLIDRQLGRVRRR